MDSGDIGCWRNYALLNTMADSISLNQLRTEADYNLISLYEDNDEDGMANDSPFHILVKAVVTIMSQFSSQI